MSTMEDNRKQLHELRDTVRELRDEHLQVHHNLKDAVEELRERHAQLNMVQNNEKRRVSGLTARLDHVEDELKTMGDAVQARDEKTQDRLDSISAMIGQVLLNTEKEKSSRKSEEAKKEMTGVEAMDYSFAEPIHRESSSVLATPATTSTYDTARTSARSLYTAEGNSANLAASVLNTPKPVLSSTKKSQVVIQEEPMVVDSTSDSGLVPSNSTLPTQDITKYIVDTMAKTMTQGLNSVIQKEEPKSKPPIFRGGSRDGSVDNWLTLVRRYLEKQKPKQSPRDQSWTIIELLDGEARNYIMNKPAPEINEPESVLRLLNNRFGTGASKALIRTSFASRVQKPDESLMQYLDALESLRSKGFPDEPMATRRYEIMQRFIKGVKSAELNSMLSIKYSDEKFIDDPPTEEQLRFTVHEFSRMREAGLARPKPVVTAPETKEAEVNIAPSQLRSNRLEDASIVEVIHTGCENVRCRLRKGVTNK